ncbi:MAG: hypothetical protein ACYC9M_14925 [Desulfobulbaceae bacterium]
MPLVKRIFDHNTQWLLFFLVSVGMIGLIGCAARQVSPEIQAYDMRVMSQPTTFTIPTEKAEEAWSRAQQFVATLSSFRIQTSTEYVIQTYMIDSSWPKYGYSVTRTVSGNNTNFMVKGYCTNIFSGDRADYNAHALSHYMVTGELMEQRINR